MKASELMEAMCPTSNRAPGSNTGNGCSCLPYLNSSLAARTILIILLALFRSPHVNANPNDDAIFVSGNWVGKAHFSSSGQFSSCTMRALYESGTEIYFVVNDDSGWALGMNNKKWDMQVGTQGTATIQIDQRPPVTGNVRVISSGGFYILFDQKNELLKDLKRGREMVVYLEKFRAKYELKGTGKAIQDLEECATNRSKMVIEPTKNDATAENDSSTDGKSRDNSANSTASLGSQKNQGAGDTQKRMEIIKTVEKYLIQQGIVNFTIIESRDHPQNVDYDVMWKAPNRDYGGVKIITGAGPSNIDQIAGQIIAHDAGMCTGEFASVKKLSEQSGDEFMRSITTVCHNTSGSQEIQYYLYDRKNGSYVKIAQSTTVSAGNTKDQNELGGSGSRVNPDRSIIDSLPK